MKRAFFLGVVVYAGLAGVLLASVDSTTTEAPQHKNRCTHHCEMIRKICSTKRMEHIGAKHHLCKDRKLSGKYKSKCELCEKRANQKASTVKIEEIHDDNSTADKVIHKRENIAGKKDSRGNEEPEEYFEVDEDYDGSVEGSPLRSKRPVKLNAPEALPEKREVEEYKLPEEHEVRERKRRAEQRHGDDARVAIEENSRSGNDEPVPTNLFQEVTSTESPEEPVERKPPKPDTQPVVTIQSGAATTQPQSPEASAHPEDTTDKKKPKKKPKKKKKKNKPKKKKPGESDEKEVGPGDTTPKPTPPDDYYEEVEIYPLDPNDVMDYLEKEYYEG